MANHLQIVKSDLGMELVSDRGNWIMKQDIGFSPVQSLVAAVGACGCYVYDRILTNSKVEHELLGVDINYETNQESKVHTVTKINLTFKLKVNADQQDLAVRTLTMVNKNCPVMQSLDPKIQIIETVVCEAY